MRDISAQIGSKPQHRAHAIAHRLPWAIAMFAVLLGFALRAWTVRGGLPYVDHPDEPNPINYVIEMLRTGDLNPHHFQKPHLYVYLLLGVLGLHYRWGSASGMYGPLESMQITTHIFTTLPGFFIWGRMLTVTLASLTIAGLVLVGRRGWSTGAGLIAGLFLAVAPFHLRHSQYVTTDVATGLLVLLAFAAALELVRRGRWRDYLLVGLLAGMAASTKYNAGVIALAVPAVHLLRWGRSAPAHIPRLLAAGATASGGFVLGTPFALLSFPEFWRGIAGQIGDYSAGVHGDYTGAWNLGAYAGFFWFEGLGPVASLATLIGVTIWLRQPAAASHPRRSAALVWLAFVLPYLALHMAQSSHFMRNMIALIVLCALPIGIAGHQAIDWLGRRLPRQRAIGATAVLLLLLVPPLGETIGYTQRLLRGDTRVRALEWIAVHVPPGERIAAELRPIPDGPESRWADAGALPERDMAWYRQQGYAYVIASSHEWRQWDVPEAYEQFRSALVAAFGGDSPRAMLGPRLLIYDTGLTAADAPDQPAAIVQIGGARLVGAVIGRPLAEAPQLGIERTRALRAGEALGLRTFWEVVAPYDRDYFIFVHVLDSTGAIVAQRDAPPWQGRFPTSSWRTGSIVVDINSLALPAELAPGAYTLVAGMFDPVSGTRPAMTLDGAAYDPSAVELGRITIIAE